MFAAGCSYSSPNPGGVLDPDAATDPDASNTTVDGPSIDAPPSMASCPGYSPIAGGFPAGATYRGVSTRTTWSAARQACQADGGDLVVIDNAAEAMAIVGLAQDPGSSPYIWVGLFDDPNTATDNDFISVRGGAAPYLAWGDAQPTGGGQDCILVDDIDTPPAFFDFGCTATQVYVCECLP